MIAQFSRLPLGLLFIAVVLLTTTTCSSEDRKEYVKPRALRPRVVSSLTRSQLLDLPTISAVIVALTFLILLLPLRVLRLQSVNAQSTKRKDPPSAATVSRMEEVAQLTRKIMDAIEKNTACANQTACEYAVEAKALGGRQDMVFSLLEILLPERWRASIAVMREAANAKEPKEFCKQFSCESNEVNPQPAEKVADTAAEDSSTVEWVE